MSSSAYIANLDNTSKIYFDFNLSPLPLLKYKFSGSVERHLNTRDSSGNIIPGGADHYVGGAHISQAFFNVNCPVMSRSVYASIIARISGCSSFLFSPDGAKYYEVTAGDDMGEPEEIDGSDYISWNLKFNVVQELTFGS